jgi:ketosteroid isomerase-like protein
MKTMEETMKPVAIIVIAWTLILAAWLACTNPSGNAKEVEIEKIARVVDACIGWAKEKNLDLVFSTVANDSTYLSVHPSSRVVRGFDQFKEAVPFWMNPDFQYVRHDIRDLTVRLSQSGDVAWFYCMLDDINTWKGQPANWENTRWTGVLEKRDGRWVIVQQHFSFASDG